MKQTLPEQMLQSIEAYVGCVAGAVLIREYEEMITTAGLNDIKITVTETKILDNTASDPMVKEILSKLEPGTTPSDYIATVYVEGRK